jgi:hypothetical protein
MKSHAETARYVDKSFRRLNVERTVPYAAKDHPICPGAPSHPYGSLHRQQLRFAIREVPSSRTDHHHHGTAKAMDAFYGLKNDLVRRRHATHGEVVA